MLEIGRVVGEWWRIDRELGEGGIARVFRVCHTRFGTYRALKVLKVRSDEIQERLEREGAVQARLKHDNILEVIDLCRVDESPGLLIEYIDGPALNQWLKGRSLSTTRARILFDGILEGVAAAHEMGVIHRDLKPGNVLLATRKDRIIPKVADFGLAKMVSDGDAGPNATASGMALGTPAYMAPEQFRSTRDVDKRADVFALGCILYELICGRKAFAGRDSFDFYEAITHGRYTPPEAIVDELPRNVVDVIHASLSADPDARPASCEVLREMLESPQRSLAPSAAVSVDAMHVAVETQAPTGRAPFADATAAATDAPTSGTLPPFVGEPTFEATGDLLREPTAKRGPRPVLVGAAIGSAVLALVFVVAIVGAVVAWQTGFFENLFQSAPSETAAPPISSTPVSAPGPNAPTSDVPAGTPPVEAAPLPQAPISEPEKPVATPTKTTTKPSAPPTPAVVKGTVKVSGDATRLLLVAKDGKRLDATHGLAVPVGTYDVIATFPDGTTITRYGLAIVGPQGTGLKCQSIAQNCVAQ